jgi:hypothetical protein
MLIPVPRYLIPIKNLILSPRIMENPALPELIPATFSSVEEAR